MKQARGHVEVTDHVSITRGLSDLDALLGGLHGLGESAKLRETADEPAPIPHPKTLVDRLRWGRGEIRRRQLNSTLILAAEVMLLFEMPRGKEPEAEVAKPLGNGVRTRA